jgi:lipopolysaccharide transport system ATP-binding protein
MRKAEIKSKFDEIVAFAEIEKFLETPVKHYSSGMYVRLAFAVAAHLDPEILIVDEVLAVGDTAFQKKCLGKMQQVSTGGRTVLFVSHNLAAVENLCRRGVVLERGTVVYQGPAKEAVRQYTHSLFGQHTVGSVFDLTNVPRLPRVGKFLNRVELFTEGNVPVMPGIRIGESLQVHIHFDLPKLTSSFNIGLGFNDLTQQRIFTAHSFFEPNHGHEERVGPQVIVCEIPSFTLMPGEYSMRLWLDIGNTEADLIEDAAQVTVLESDYYGTGKAPWNGAFVLPHNWRLKPAGWNSPATSMEGESVALKS